MQFCWRNAVALFAFSIHHLPRAFAAFDITRDDNLVVYWGQDSSGNQQPLSFYCQDGSIDTIPLAFLFVFFGQGGEPMIEFSNICSASGNPVFPSTQLANCSFLAPDIRACQDAGVAVTLSLGGATGSVGFVNVSQAESFADDIWNMFLGGESDTRPLGDAVLDGVDLDIEGGLPDFYPDFVNRLRTHMRRAKKRYYLTAAPQCPFPDAYLGEAISGAPFDAVYVQFYNNYCGLNHPDQFDFATWDNWARAGSPNPDIKVYIGAPGDPRAAGQGYVDIEALQQYAQEAQKNYSSFGGVMLWDASSAYDNDRFDKAIKDSLRSGGRSVPGPGRPGGPGIPGGGQQPIPGQCLVAQQEQSAFAVEGRLWSRDGLRMVAHESWAAVAYLASSARRHVIGLAKRAPEIVRTTRYRFRLTHRTHA